MAFKQLGWPRRPALGIALLTGWAAAAFGLQPLTPLASYGRQTWVMENGLPQNTVQALVQGANGFLWIGTEVGLVRFDGNGFQVFDKDTVPALPGNDVHCLFSTQDGALWIGTGDGLARWKDNAIRVFTTNDGLPANSIVGLNAGGSEGLVVKTTAGSAEFKDGRFQPVSMVPEQLVQKGNVAFHSDFLTNLTNGMTAYGSKTDLELHRGGEFVARLAVGKELPGTRIQSVFADREGALWIGTNGGLARWSEREAPDPSRDRLALFSFDPCLDGGPRRRPLDWNRSRRTAHTSRSTISHPGRSRRPACRRNHDRRGRWRWNAVGGNGRIRT